MHGYMVYRSIMLYNKIVTCIVQKHYVSFRKSTTGHIYKHYVFKDIIFVL